MDEVMELAYEAETLLGWHNTRTMRDLTLSFPDLRDWKYAVQKLRGAKWQSFPYLIKCLETSVAKRGDAPRLGPPYLRPDHNELCFCERCWPFKVPRRSPHPSP